MRSLLTDEDRDRDEVSKEKGNLDLRERKLSHGGTGMGGRGG